MSTTILLVRHASCDAVGTTIAGRAPGVVLNAKGCAELPALAALTAGVPLVAVYTSPRERARQTALALALPRGLELRELAAFDELDYGDWTGMSLTELADRPEWRMFNTRRVTARIPGGELVVAAQTRAVSALEALRRRHDGEAIACVTHYDIIRMALASYLGLPLNASMRLHVEPASVSMVIAWEGGASIRAINQMVEPMAWDRPQAARPQPPTSVTRS